MVHKRKVSLEVVSGASMAGPGDVRHEARGIERGGGSFSMSYIGVNGGLVIVDADDPGLSARRTNRQSPVCTHAKLPMLEPSDSQSALISRRPPDILNALTHRFFASRRICHSKSVVETGERMERHSGVYPQSGKNAMLLPGEGEVL